MSSNTLYRLSGLGLLLSGILAAIGVVLYNVVSGSTNPAHLTGYILAIAGAMLIVICLVGVYVRQATQTGVLGLLGFVFLVLSRLFLPIAFQTFNGLILPSLVSAAPHVAAVEPPATIVLILCGALTSILGAIFFSIASIRAGVFPRWIPILLLVGFILNTAINFLDVSDFGLSGVLIQVAYASFGYVLFTRSRVETALRSSLSVASQA